MTVLLDTSLLAAVINSDDPRHREAKSLWARILAGEFGVPVTSDYVLDEGLTLLQRRTGRVRACHDFSSFFLGDGRRPPPLVLRFTHRKELDRATSLFYRHFDRGLSFTDCILAALADELGAAIASFDTGFDGLAPRIPHATATRG